jgi:hypothetical protein
MARTRLFDPDSASPFALSRAKVELFRQCPRCFYLDRRLGIARPAGFPFNLNSAVDALLKAEFDAYRHRGEPHPLMVEAGLNAVPAPHPELIAWRENFKGVRARHEPTGLELFGAVDDLWRDLDTGELIVVDYKSTSKSSAITLDADWQIAYKRQMEFYQWLLRQRGESVSRTGWFVYCNGLRDRPAFDARLDFAITLIPYEGDDSWVEGTLSEIRANLMSPEPPAVNLQCEYCTFAGRAAAAGRLSS